MSKLTKTNIEILQNKVRDKKLKLADRKLAYEELMQGVLNPKEVFDPETFDPMEGVEDFEVKKRDRVKPPKKLPTFGLKPKKLFEGQMIGMFESKQDLYLLIAWLSERLSDLEDEVKLLKP